MTDDPYQTPADIRPPRSESVPPTREDLADLMRRFLADEITAFQFDEQLDVFHDADDEVIRYVAEAVWYHYDDCDDHHVCLSKEEWNYFQRLLLLLSSDCRIDTQRHRHWTWRQPVAAVSLAMFVCCALSLGWGYHLFAVAIPFGGVSMLLSGFRHHPRLSDDPLEPILFPFASMSDLETAYRSSTFRKARYPVTMAGRRIRSELMEFLYLVQFRLTWLILSPVALAFQMWPETTIRQTAKAL